MTVKGDIESLFFGPVWLRQAEVPLADVRSAIADVVERFG